MDIKVIIQKISDFIKKNRYVVLILIAGIVLMCLPTGRKDNTDEIESLPIEKEVSVEDRLSQILSQVDGAGEVQVFLTIASGEQTIYQTNDTLSHNDESENTQISTVTVTDSKRNELGLIRQINPPMYQGAIIVCRGADSSAVRLAVVDAVSKVTGLSSDKISVMKMK